MFRVRTQLVSKIKLIDIFPPALCAFSLPFFLRFHTLLRGVVILFHFFFIATFHFTSFALLMSVLVLNAKEAQLIEVYLNFLYQSQNHEIDHFFPNILIHKSFNFWFISIKNWSRIFSIYKNAFETEIRSKFHMHVLTLKIFLPTNPNVEAFNWFNCFSSRLFPSFWEVSMHFDVFSCVRGFEEEVRWRQNSHKRVKLCFYGVDGEKWKRKCSLNRNEQAETQEKSGREMELLIFENWNMIEFWKEKSNQESNCF